MVLFVEGAERKFTLEELKQCDGQEGRPAYIAFNGKVYNVTDSPLWLEGDHQGLHVAGKDLTIEMSEAPHGEETLANMKVVGVLVQ